MHGEMPDWFSPDVWWVSLGMNDLGRMQCSEEVVVMGILRVVEEILEKKPNAQVVLNSMLPMADLRGGIYPHMRDYQDAFSQNPNAKASHYVRTKPVKNDDKKKNRRWLRKKIQEEEEGEDANNPEKLDKKTLKRYKRKDPVNPVLDPNKTTMKKYQLLKKNRLPLWTSITAINKALKKFCANQDGVTFYDATSIFTDQGEQGKYMLKSDYISIRGHPTVAGFEAWENAMLKQLKSMLAEEEETKKEIVKYTVNDDDDNNADDDDNADGDDKDMEEDDDNNDDFDEEKKESSSSESRDNPSSGKARRA